MAAFTNEEYVDIMMVYGRAEEGRPNTMASTFPGLYAVRFYGWDEQRIGVRHRNQNVEDLRERIEAAFQKIQQKCF
ncbi:hypothetical protein EVAR_8399_1 [Eumeta japonica]|uniref:Uncharacterized protein n=1 Tax=Eumeta variegata TaxID=151549 RepID=A0A4C2AHV3_EUMVA|nr:hypothetical protein EVAR_8399_1 [Eumeta japonica]